MSICTVSVAEERKVVQTIKSEPYSFDEIYKDHLSEIYKYFYIRTFSVQDAEDLTAQTFTDVYVKLGSFKWQGKPVIAWIYGIARNHYLNFYKKRKVRGGQVEFNEENLEHFAQGDFESSIVSKDSMRNFLFSLKKLSPIYQEVVYLKLFEDKSFKEISQILRKNESTCRVIASRAVQKIKSEIKREELC